MLYKLLQWQRIKHHVEMVLIVRNIFSTVLDVMEIHPFYGLCMEAESCLSAFAGTFYEDVKLFLLIIDYNVVKIIFFCIILDYVQSLVEFIV